MAGTGIDGIATAQSNYEKYKDLFTEKKNDLITMDSFYQLLVAEMQNQDPLEPTSNTEFISQMASFTALQSQQDTQKTQLQNYANSLVGKTVTVTSPTGDAITGKVEYVTYGDSPQVSVNGTKYGLSAIKQMHTSAESGGIGDHGAFATGLLGKTAVVQAMSADGQTFIDEGVVSSLEIQDGEVRIIVNGYAYAVTDVLRVTETPVQTEQVTDNGQTAQAENNTAGQTEAAAENSTAAAENNAAAAEEASENAEYTDEEDIPDIEETELYKLFE